MNIRIALCALSLVAFAVPCEASVTISTKATQNMSCSAGVCSPTAKKAVLNVNDLTNMLASGDVKITTGAGAVTITVESPFSWTSTSRLTLDAHYNVSFRTPVTVAGQGAVTITYNDGGSGGDLIFFPGAKLDFWDLSSSLVINGQDYVLVRDIAGMIAHVGHSLALTADYDAEHDGDFHLAPIKKVNATIEGLGHAIQNLHVGTNKPRCLGLIGQLEPTGLVRDIEMTDATIYDDESGDVGTLVGCNYGIVANSTANGGEVLGEAGAYGGAVAGGLVGLNASTGLIVNSHTNLSVGGAGAYAGGLVGDSLGLVTRSYATSSVGGTGIIAGGLAGRCYDCRQSFATGPVSAFLADINMLGGFVGEATYVEDSYSTGSVAGPPAEDFVGGFVGRGCCVIRSYSMGVTSENGFRAPVGGFIGDVESAGDALDYWDIDTSGQDHGCGQGDCSGVTGLTDTRMKSGLPAGFDPKIWGQRKNINNGYPYLLANPPPE